MIRAVLFACVAIALCAVEAQDKFKLAEWPCFRGVNRDNHSPDKGLLKSWSKVGPKLLWRGAGVGDGFSSVAVAGDKVFTMGDKGRASYLTALARSSGKVLWSSKVGEAGGNYTGPRCTPTVDGGYVYGLGQFGDLVCVEAKGGKEVWRKSFKNDFDGRSGHWNFTESPLIDGDKLICTPGGRDATMVALDKKSGAEVWRCPAKLTAGYASPVISEGGGVKQYVQLTAGGTIGVRASDGKLLWRNSHFDNNTANIPTPIVLKDQIFSCAGYGQGGMLLTLSGDGDGVKATEEYFERALNNKHGGVVIVGNYAFADSDDGGRPYCAEWKTGKVLWTRGRIGPGSGSASLTYADGSLYIRYSNGWVSLVPAVAKGYSESGSFKIPNSDSNSWAHPVVVGGRLYLREKDVVWCYDVRAK